MMKMTIAEDNKFPRPCTGQYRTSSLCTALTLFMWLFWYYFVSIVCFLSTDWRRTA